MGSWFPDPSITTRLIPENIKAKEINNIFVGLLIIKVSWNNDKMFLIIGYVSNNNKSEIFC